MRRFRLLPALFLLVGTAAAQNIGFYARADLAKAWNTKEAEDEDDEALVDLQEQTKSGVQWSFLGAVMNESKVFGGGLFYAGFRSSGELGSPYAVGDFTFTKYDPVVSISVLGGAAVFRHALGERLVWTGEFGMGKATETDEIDIKGVVADGTVQYPATGKATITGDGMVFLLGTGMDLMLTPSLGLGAGARWIKGQAEDPSMKISLTVNGMSMSQKEDIDDVSEIDILSLGGGLRLVF